MESYNRNGRKVIQLSAFGNTTRYLIAKKRRYSHTDMKHRRHGFLCRLLSMPKGFQVTQASKYCKHLEGKHFRTVAGFEREYLRRD